MNTFDPTLDPRAFRDALGQYATGVTVVTVPSQEGPIGITANSFASVSLDPPLVLWSPAKSSRRFNYFSAAQNFAIHILDANQQDICNGFVKDKSAFAGLDWDVGDHNVPLINGCLARFSCRLQAEHDAGDHTIIVGKVISASARTGTPLTFQGGRYVSIET
ncbi:flavin reductase family protein [Loktanella agnita]|uniref:flavin reductase family protein n=1 Tax=Loktanella agnita TaxID=287097 RepID=UPI003988EFAB